MNNECIEKEKGLRGCLGSWVHLEGRWWCHVVVVVVVYVIESWEGLFHIGPRGRERERSDRKKRWEREGLEENRRLGGQGRNSRSQWLTIFGH